jgi:hypothetical protein
MPWLEGLRNPIGGTRQNIFTMDNGARFSNGENGWPLRNMIHSASGKLEIAGAWDK